jgi:predicted ATPase
MAIGDASLPAPASSFVGRERELAEARGLLSETRLLTVKGPGGAGKTRFALELARRAVEEQLPSARDGVVTVFLAPLRDPSLVLTTIAHALSIRERPRETALHALIRRLDGTRTLLVVDNMEHVLASVEELAELLAACRRLTLIATSREPLRLSGELGYDLPPLGGEDSVALFCERAVCAPSASVADICARLEGLPLAIELAAARTSLLSPEQLLARLSRRLDLLKAALSADPRHETLRATIQWSYDLLTPDEQAHFEQLSVFAGGCTLEAAREVSGAEALSLESLVDKSLLRRSETELAPRFWMLETIRDFASETLAASGERERATAAHTAFFVRLAEQLAPARYGAETAEERMRFEADRANFQVVLWRAIEAGDASTALRLVRLLGDLWYRASGLHETARIFREALALPGGDAPDRAWALLQASRIAFDLGRRAEYRSFSAASEAIFTEMGDIRGLWQVVQERAHYETVLGNHADAIRAGERAVGLARTEADREHEMIATAELAEAMLESELDRAAPDQEVLAQAQAMYQTVVAWATSEASGLLESHFMLNFGWLLCRIGEYGAALEHMQAGIRIGLRERVPWRLLKSYLLEVGLIASALGHQRVTVELIAFARVEFEREGEEPEPVELRLLVEARRLARTTLGDEEFEQAGRRGEQLTPEQAVELALGIAPGG